MRKVILIVGLIVFAIALGFYQELLKISINYILENAPRIAGFYDLSDQQQYDMIEAQRSNAPFDYYHSHETLRWLYSWNEQNLYRLKWGVTFCSIGVFFFINAALIKLLANHKHIVKRLALFYLLFTVVAFAIYGVGKILSMPEQTYAISRRIIGALQSLVPVMIFWPFIHFSKQNH